MQENLARFVTCISDVVARCKNATQLTFTDVIERVAYLIDLAVEYSAERHSWCDVFSMYETMFQVFIILIILIVVSYICVCYLIIISVVDNKQILLNQ